MLAFGVFFASLAFANALPILESLLPFTTRADPLCNGNAALCGRTYSKVTFVGAHDSAFVGPLPTQNQELSVKDQLGSGIRFLQSQTHWFANQLAMCHTSCELEFGGFVKDYLNTVKTFLDQNPREVVTILLTNPDSVGMDKFDALYKSVGLDKYAFKPSTSPKPMPMSSWPTLGDMITQNQRLVTFIDYGADESKVSYLLDEFNYFWETPFDTTDPKFAQCTIDRKNKLDGSGKSSMYIVNHFLDVEIFGMSIPDRDNAGKTNAKTGDGSIGAQSDLCVKSMGRTPNVVLLDYSNKGDAMGAQKRLNNL